MHYIIKHALHNGTHSLNIIKHAFDLRSMRSMKRSNPLEPPFCAQNQPERPPSRTPDKPNCDNLRSKTTRHQFRESPKQAIRLQRGCDLTDFEKKLEPVSSFFLSKCAKSVPRCSGMLGFRVSHNWWFQCGRPSGTTFGSRFAADPLKPELLRRA
jgi:hypothetical protein